jgi:chemotaxis signal transduction protein
VSPNATTESRTPRPWLKPTAALARFAPAPRTNRDPIDHGAQVRERTEIRYGYRVSDIGLLVGKHVGCEVISLPTLARIPTLPAWVLGVANLRGSLVPMFDLQALLEVPTSAECANRFGLIFDRGEQAVGIFVAEYPQPLERLVPLPHPPPMPAPAREFVATAYRHDDSLWLEFDHRRFFDSVAQRLAR